ncbi:MAG: MATE family efflux transporter [Alistipes sp.]|nr:MATE family efflux transporter [Alistipes sp.]
MEEQDIKLSEKDRKFRDFALNGNMWSVLFKVCTPLAVFQMVNHLFTILDTMMASHISAEAVSTVAYLSQLQLMISAIGTGLAAGSCIKISEAYGAGDFALVKQRISSLITICFGMGLVVTACLPFAPLFLRVTGTPEAFISIGSRYFVISLLATVFSFFNNVYIAIERSRGKSRRIMFLNMGIMILKLSLTAVFVYGMKSSDITMIAVATLVSQFVLFLIAVANLSRKQEVFGFAFSYITMKKDVVNPMINLSVPVIVEKIAFAMGKTVVNSMSKNYGELTVGALGISNNVDGIVSNAQNGFQDGGAAIISQNLGGGRRDRALDAFRKLLVINVIIGIVGWVLINVFIEPITYLFANSTQGFNEGFQQTIIHVLRYDSFGSCMPLGINCAVMALLFGFGKTKLTLLINFCRVFVFRIPVLWALQNFTDLGSESVGIVMAVSNICVAVMSSIIAWIVIRKMKKEEATVGDKGE